MTGMQQPAHREAVEPAMSREGVHSRRVVAGSMARSSAQAMDCIWGISSRPPTNANFGTASRRYTGYRRRKWHANNAVCWQCTSSEGPRQSPLMPNNRSTFRPLRRRQGQ
jgi:hypothetical protein